MNNSLDKKIAEVGSIGLKKAQSRNKLVMKILPKSSQKHEEEITASTSDIAFKHQQHPTTTNVKIEVSENMNSLSPVERLQHAKKILNQKLVTKLPIKTYVKSSVEEKPGLKTGSREIPTILPKTFKIVKIETDSQGVKKLPAHPKAVGAPIQPMLINSKEISKLSDFSYESCTVKSPENNAAGCGPFENFPSSKTTNESLLQKQGSLKVSKAKNKHTTEQRNKSTAIKLEEDVTLEPCLPRYSETTTTYRIKTLSSEMGKAVEKRKNKNVEEKPWALDTKQYLQEFGDEEFLKVESEKVDAQNLQGPSNCTPSQQKHKEYNLQPHHSQRQQHILQKIMKQQQIQQFLQEKKQQLQQKQREQREQYLSEQSEGTVKKKLPAAFTSSSQSSDDDVIPKASIRSRTKSGPKLVSRPERSSNFPQVSSLTTAAAVPSISLPSATPLSRITTLRKTLPLQTPRSHVTAADVDHCGYPTKLNANNLIVLEDKVLTKDEKIDLTLFRLPKPKLEPKSELDTLTAESPQSLPPNQVKKEEVFHQDGLLPAIGTTVSTDPQQTRVFVNPMQPKKFIVAADKLKMSKEKIAELAKHIKMQAKEKLEGIRRNKLNATSTVNPIISREAAKINSIGKVANGEKHTVLQQSSPLRLGDTNTAILKAKSLQTPPSSTEVPSSGCTTEMSSLLNNDQVATENINNTQTPSSLNLSKAIPKVGSIIEFSPKIPDKHLIIKVGSASLEAPSRNSSEFMALDSDLLEQMTPENSEPPQVTNSFQSVSLNESQVEEKSSIDSTSVQVVPQAGSLSEPLAPEHLEEKLEFMEIVTEPKETQVIENTKKSDLEVAQSSIMKSNCERVANAVVDKKAHTEPTKVMINSRANRKVPSVCIINEPCSDSSLLSAVDFIAELALSTKFNESSMQNLSTAERELNCSLSTDCSIMSTKPEPTNKSLKRKDAVATETHPDKNEIDATKLLSHIFTNDTGAKCTAECGTNAETEKSEALKCDQMANKKAMFAKPLIDTAKVEHEERVGFVEHSAEKKNDILDNLQSYDCKSPSTKTVNKVLYGEAGKITANLRRSPDKHDIGSEICPEQILMLDNKKRNLCKAESREKDISAAQKNDPNEEHQLRPKDVSCEEESAASNQEVTTSSNVTGEKRQSSGNTNTAKEAINEMSQPENKEYIGANKGNNLKSDVDEKRMSRFKKGKINLVQRKQNVAAKSIREKEENTTKVGEEKSGESNKSHISNEQERTIEQISKPDDVENEISTSGKPTNRKPKIFELEKPLDNKDNAAETRIISRENDRPQDYTEFSTNLSSTFVENLDQVNVGQMVAKETATEGTHPSEKPFKTIDSIRSSDTNSEKVDGNCKQWQTLNSTEQRQKETEAAKILVSLLQSPNKNDSDKTLEVISAPDYPLQAQSKDAAPEKDSKMDKQNVFQQEYKCLEELSKDNTRETSVEKGTNTLLKEKELLSQNDQIASIITQKSTIQQTTVTISREISVAEETSQEIPKDVQHKLNTAEAKNRKTSETESKSAIYGVDSKKTLTETESINNELFINETKLDDSVEKAKMAEITELVGSWEGNRGTRHEKYDQSAETRWEHKGSKRKRSFETSDERPPTENITKKAKTGNKIQEKRQQEHNINEQQKLGHNGDQEKLSESTVVRASQSDSAEVKRASTASVGGNPFPEHKQPTAGTISDQTEEREYAQTEYSVLGEDSTYYDETGNEDSLKEITKVKSNLKRLRHTLDDIKNKRLTKNNLDSDEKNCEMPTATAFRRYSDADSVEFHGFDESLQNDSDLEENLNRLISMITERCHEEECEDRDENSIAEVGKCSRQISKPTVGNIKHWLTTGKAGQPPGSKAVAYKYATNVPLRIMPLKKRWELTQQQKCLETDNTLPAHDDDDNNEQTSIHQEKYGAIDELNRSSSKKKSLKKIDLYPDEEKNAQQIIRINPDTVLGSSRCSNFRGETQDIAGSSIETELTPLNNNSSPEEECSTSAKTSSTKFRKRNHSRTIAASGNTVAGDICEKTIADNETLLPKRRGRKPKVSTVSITKNTDERKDTSRSMLSDTSLDETLPKKRGRKPKNFSKDTILCASTPVKTETASQSGAANEVTLNSTNNTTSRSRQSTGKRGRKPKVTAATTETSTEATQMLENENNTVSDLIPESGISNSDLSQSQSKKTDVSLLTPITTARKKPGRKSTLPVLKSTEDSQSVFNPRLLLVRSRAQLDTDEPLTESAGEAEAGSVKCGLCLANVGSTKFKPHLGQHYGIGWIQGQTELNLSVRSNVLNTMVNYYKDTKVKALNCRICDRPYRSALGLLLHLETCGFSAEEQQKNRVECPLCKNSYSRLSYVTHIRTCSARSDSNTTQDSMPAVATNAEEVLNNVGRIKRRSLMKAESKLKAIGQELLSTAEMDFLPEKYVKHHPPICIDDYRQRYLHDLENSGKAFCPQKLCRFTCLDFDEMEKHIRQCSSMTKSGYQCTLCKTVKVFKTHVLALNHVKTLHAPNRQVRDFEADGSDCQLDSESSSEECSSGVNSNEDEVMTEGNNEGSKAKSNKKKKRRRGDKHSSMPLLQTNKKPLYPPRSPHTQSNVIKKWQQFIEQNYSDDILFNYGNAIYTLRELQSGDSCKILPCQENSMKFALSKSRKINTTFGMPELLEWMQLSRFETTSDKNDNITFIGAPIKAIAWAPLPREAESPQFLAIAYRKHVDKFTRTVNPKISDTLILIYEINMKATAKKMQLHYGLRIPNGPVHCLGFLPSGGYAPAANRLGLLAVGTAASDIRIYSLPLRVETPFDKGEEANPLQHLRVVDLQPAFVLTLDLIEADKHEDDETLRKTVQCTCIKWSEARGHNHIVAGYTNGFVSVWDINADENENINAFMVNSVRHFVPVNYFFMGERCVRDMALHYDTTGLRWLVVFSNARKLVVYDLRDVTNPLIMYDQLSRNIATSLDWPVMWEGFCLAMDGATPNNAECTLLRSAMYVNFGQSKIHQMVCGVTQVRYNPWQSISVSSTENGEIWFHGMRELYYEMVHKTTAVWKAVSTLDMKCLDGSELPKRSDKTISHFHMFEADNKNEYGLVFQPITAVSSKVSAAYTRKERVPPHHAVRHMRINCLSCNLNVGSQELVACGFENGFLRVLSFSRRDYFN